MVTRDESDAQATGQVLEIIGSDVIGQLAQAAREHDVSISLYIVPKNDNDETAGDD